MGEHQEHDEADGDGQDVQGEPEAPVVTPASVHRTISFAARYASATIPNGTRHSHAGKLRRHEARGRYRLILLPPLAPPHRAGLLESAAVAGAGDAGVALAAVTVRAGHGHTPGGGSVGIHAGQSVMVGCSHAGIGVVVILILSQYAPNGIQSDTGQ